MSDRLRPKAITQPTASHRVIRRLLRGEFGFGRTLLWFFLGGHVALELISRLLPDLSGKGWLLVAASPAQALVLRGLWRSAGAIARPALKRLAKRPRRGRLAHAGAEHAGANCERNAASAKRPAPITRGRYLNSSC